MTALGESPPRSPKLGRYELITRIGHGGMAEVQLALQRGPAGFEKLVVVKLVHENLASQKTFVDMLLDEARMAALVKHPNVVDIYDLGEAEGRYFIAMEYLEGEPLLAVLRAGRDGRRLDVLSTARLIADTAEGLDAAHELRSLAGDAIELVHHDVSLGNIVVLYNGQVKLVDFGVAKATQSSTARTRIQGKFSYMAPEKLRGGAGDRRSDIWSLGCVLWEALTLRRLFKGANDTETMHQVLDGPILAPSQVNGDVPADFDAICMRALSRDLDQRYATAKVMAAELEDVLHEHGYAAKNDQIARYMQATFDSHIAARKKLLQEVSSKGSASTDLVEAAFHDETPADIRSQEIKRSDIDRTAPPFGGADGRGQAPTIEASRVKAIGTGQLEPQPLPKLLPTESTDATQVSTAETRIVEATVTEAELRRVDLAIGTNQNARVSPAEVDGDAATVADGAALPPTGPVVRPALGASPPSTFAPMRRFEIPNIVPLVARPVVPAQRPAKPASASTSEVTTVSPAARAIGSGVMPPAVAPVAMPVAAAPMRVHAGDAGESDARPAPNKRWMIYPAAAAAILAAIVVTSMTMGHRAAPAQVAAAPTEIAAPVLPPPSPSPIERGEPVAALPPTSPEPASAPAPAPKPAPVATRPEPTDTPRHVPAPRHVAAPRTAAKPVEKLNPSEVFKTGLQAWVHGDTRTALASYKRVIAANPEYAPAWRGAGLVYEKLGDKPAARAAFQKYLRLAPDADDAPNIRARVLAP